MDIPEVAENVHEEVTVNGNAYLDRSPLTMSGPSVPLVTILTSGRPISPTKPRLDRGISVIPTGH